MAEGMSKDIQWFPGHMTKARRRMEADLGKVDMLIEIVDARIPISSRNPELAVLAPEKPRLLILNKADLADKAGNARWTAWFRKQGYAVLEADCRSGKGLQHLNATINKVMEEQRAVWERKGMIGRQIKAMVVGIPNVGKSSFINRICKTGSRAKTEDRPGVTRDNRWYAVSPEILLLDTPGVLWPKFQDQTVGLHLAFTGAVRDDILDVEELACVLLDIMRREYPDALKTRYKITDELEEQAYDLLAQIGRKRGMLVSGGEVNTERAARMLLDEYRGGKLGALTLEFPPETEKTV
ncbi:MAG: ribosome biogenesis GTPase YlqF [Clostridia bacterium]|nr:ribosome biogenesis GTPase YlqF [Clostridia bacterium]